MTLRSIFVPIVESVGAQTQLETALTLARAVQAHINAIYIRRNARDVTASMLQPAMTLRGDTDTVKTQGLKVEAAAKAAFEEWRLRNGLANAIVHHSLHTPFARWTECIGNVGAVTEHEGRLNDLAIITWPTEDHLETEEVFDAAVFGTGRPCILVKQGYAIDNLLRHVLIAWNGSLEATRAVAGAMTLLHAAERVSVFAAPGREEGTTGGDDLEKSLAWHGIPASVFSRHDEDRSVGDALLRVAKQQEATLLVMGALTHSRVRQLLMGGITGHVIRQATIPVLMMH